MSEYEEGLGSACFQEQWFSKLQTHTHTRRLWFGWAQGTVSVSREQMCLGKRSCSLQLTGSVQPALAGRVLKLCHVLFTGPLQAFPCSSSPLLPAAPQRERELERERRGVEVAISPSQQSGRWCFLEPAEHPLSLSFVLASALSQHT